MPHQDIDSLEDLGVVAKVTLVPSPVREGALVKHTIYFEYESGTTGTIDFSNYDDKGKCEAGDVIFIDTVGRKFEHAPTHLWRGAGPSKFVGNVLEIHRDVAIISSGNNWYSVPLGEDDAQKYHKGNGVEFQQSRILRKLSDTSFSSTAEPTPSDLAERFKVRPKDLSYDDIGGLDSVVARARELIEVPMLNRASFEEMGVAPAKGVLFTGPAGTGKTMLARIIASNANAPFYSISGPEIMSKWYGESERILRSIFEDARAQSQAIIFFDEIDSIASRRDESHEHSRRIVAQLLTLIDGFESHHNVAILATTNRPEDIDEALRRPGRIDCELAFEPPSREGRYEILTKASTRKKIDGNLRLHEFLDATEGWTGAQLTGIWSEAALLAIADGRTGLVYEDILGGVQRAAKRRNGGG